MRGSSSPRTELGPRQEEQAQLRGGTLQTSCFRQGSTSVSAGQQPQLRPPPRTGDSGALPLGQSLSGQAACTPKGMQSKCAAGSLCQGLEGSLAVSPDMVGASTPPRPSSLERASQSIRSTGQQQDASTTPQHDLQPRVVRPTTQVSASLPWRHHLQQVPAQVVPAPAVPTSPPPRRLQVVEPTVQPVKQPTAPPPSLLQIIEPTVQPGLQPTTPSFVVPVSEPIPVDNSALLSRLDGVIAEMELVLKPCMFSPLDSPLVRHGLTAGHPNPMERSALRAARSRERDASSGPSMDAPQPRSSSSCRSPSFSGYETQDTRAFAADTPLERSVTSTPLSPGGRETHLQEVRQLIGRCMRLSAAEQDSPPSAEDRRHSGPGGSRRPTSRERAPDRQPSMLRDLEQLYDAALLGERYACEEAKASERQMRLQLENCEEQAHIIMREKHAYASWVKELEAGQANMDLLKLEASEAAVARRRMQELQRERDTAVVAQRMAEEQVVQAQQRGLAKLTDELHQFHQEQAASADVRAALAAERGIAAELREELDEVLCRARAIEVQRVEEQASQEVELTARLSTWEAKAAAVELRCQELLQMEVHSAGILADARASASAELDLECRQEAEQSAQRLAWQAKAARLEQRCEELLHLEVKAASLAADAQAHARAEIEFECREAALRAMLTEEEAAGAQEAQQTGLRQQVRELQAALEEARTAEAAAAQRHLDVASHEQDALADLRVAHSEEETARRGVSDLARALAAEEERTQEVLEREASQSRAMLDFAAELVGFRDEELQMASKLEDTEVRYHSSLQKLGALNSKYQELATDTLQKEDRLALKWEEMAELQESQGRVARDMSSLLDTHRNLIAMQDARLAGAHPEQKPLTAMELFILQGQLDGMRAADAVCQQQMLASDASSDMEYLMEEQAKRILDGGLLRSSALQQELDDTSRELQKLQVSDMESKERLEAMQRTHAEELFRLQQEVQQREGLQKAKEEELRVKRRLEVVEAEKEELVRRQDRLFAEEARLQQKFLDEAAALRAERDAEANAKLQLQLELADAKASEERGSARGKPVKEAISMRSSQVAHGSTSERSWSSAFNLGIVEPGDLHRLEVPAVGQDYWHELHHGSASMAATSSVRGSLSATPAVPEEMLLANDSQLAEGGRVSIAPPKASIASATPSQPIAPDQLSALSDDKRVSLLSGQHHDPRSSTAAQPVARSSSHIPHPASQSSSLTSAQQQQEQQKHHHRHHHQELKPQQQAAEAGGLSALEVNHHGALRASAPAIAQPSTHVSPQASDPPHARASAAAALRLPFLARQSPAADVRHAADAAVEGQRLASQMSASVAVSKALATSPDPAARASFQDVGHELLPAPSGETEVASSIVAPVPGMTDPPAIQVVASSHRPSSCTVSVGSAAPPGASDKAHLSSTVHEQPAAAQGSIPPAGIAQQHLGARASLLSERPDGDAIAAVQPTLVGSDFNPASARGSEIWNGATSTDEEEGSDEELAIPEPYLEVINQVDNFGWDSMEWSHGYTLLHWAAKNDLAVLCQRFMVQKADPELRDDRGESAIELAQAFGSEKALAQLMRRRSELPLPEDLAPVDLLLSTTAPRSSTVVHAASRDAEGSKATRTLLTSGT